MNANEIHELNHPVVTIRRQEVNLSSPVLRVANETFETAHGSTAADAGLRSHVGHAVDRTEPYNVLNVDVVTDKPFLARVGIDDANEAIAMKAEIIEEGTVLTELVGIGRIVDGRIVVTCEQNQSVFHALPQESAPSYIGFFTE